MAMKLRKAAMKARHEKELNDLRNRMQKEIDQSINELKMSSDIRRMEAIEAQVNPWFYSVNKTLYLIDSCKVELICGGSAKLCEWFCNKTLFLLQNLKLISILVQQGKLQEEEIEGVLKFLFPTK